MYTHMRHSKTVNVTGFWKYVYRETVPNHAFVISYIYHCNMNIITYFKIFHDIVWNSWLKFLKLFKKYYMH